MNKNKINQNKLIDLTSESDFKSVYLDNEEKDKSYFDFLNNQLEKNNIRNIAITGGYSSGKSTFIKKFIKNRKKNKKNDTLIEISLAEFNNEDFKKSDDNNNDFKNEELKRIEEKIIFQIFYKVKNDEIPNSRFKKIERDSKCKKIGYILLYMSFILSILFLIFPEKIEQKLIYYKVIQYNSRIGMNYSFYSLLATFIISFIVLYSNYYKIKNLSFKLKYKAEVEEKPKDIFNKHIDELVYFFQATKINIVVFEDLDRFDYSKEIFLKLKELNTILNSYKGIKKDIKFIYALGDGVFDTIENKVKFFDIIIPIIPVSYYSNSENYIKERLDEIDTEIINDRSFISDISFFISDLRVIHNIINEYVVYSSIIKQETKLKILAIVIYKNIYLKDYNNLLKKKGIVFYFINRLNEIKSKIKLDLEFSKNEAKEKRNNLFDAIEKEKEKLDNIEPESEYVEGYEEMVKLEEKESLIKKEINDLNLDLEEVEITKKEIEEKIRELKNLDLKLLCREYKEKMIVYFREKIDIDKEINIDNSYYDLLYYLLSSGYIDIDYDLYITYNNPLKLKQTDIEFLENLKNSFLLDGLDINHELYEIVNILDRLNNEHFKTDKIYNIKLLEFLLKDKIYIEQVNIIYNTIFNGLKNKDENTLIFIYNFCQSIDIALRNKFIVSLFEFNNDYLTYFNIFIDSKEENRYKEFQEEIMYILLGEIDLNKINNNLELEFKKLERKEDFIDKLVKFKIEEERLEKVLKHLNLKFINIKGDYSYEK